MKQQQGPPNPISIAPGAIGLLLLLALALSLAGILASPARAQTPARTSPGLVYNSNGTWSGWTGVDSAWQSVAGPCLTASTPSPIVAQIAGYTGPDAGGVREAHPFIDTDGSWYVFYGAGDGTAGAGGPWRIQAARSTDRGLTWTKLGVVLGLSNGSGGAAWASTDNLFVEKYNGVYYLHRLTATGATDGQIPGGTYSSDVWSATNIAGPYTYVQQELSVSGSGVDTDSAYSNSSTYGTGSSPTDPMGQAGTYYLFYSASDNGSRLYGSVQNNASYAYGTGGPGGALTKSGLDLIPYNLAGHIENPDVFYSDALSSWAMLTNQINYLAGDTDRSIAFFSPSLTDWSAATAQVTQHVCPADGQYVVGLSHALRTAPNTVAVDSLGNIAVAYDTDPGNGSASSYNHQLRRILWSQLEPSTAEYYYHGPSFYDDFFTENTTALGGQNGWVDESGSNTRPYVTPVGGPIKQNLSMGETVGPSIVIRPDVSVADCTQTMSVYLGVACAVGPMFRCNSNATAFYHCDFGDASWGIAYFHGGTDTLLATGNYPGNATITNANATVSATLVGQTFTLSLNGSQFESFTDTSNYITGAGCVGIRNGQSGTSTRNVNTYSLSGPDVDHAATLPFTQPDFTLQFAARFDGNSGHLDVRFRTQTNGDAYVLRVTPGQTPALSLLTSLGGATYAPPVNDGTVSSTQAVDAGEWVWHKVKLSVSATRITAWFDGQRQVSTTDSTLTTGQGLILDANGCDVHVRRLCAYSGGSVVVTGLTAGTICTLRGAGGVPYATAKVPAGGAVSLPSDWFPLSSVSIKSGGSDADIYAPTGGIWGGDVIAASIPHPKGSTPADKGGH